MNATQAAIRAGYSQRTAYSQGQRLLKNLEVFSEIDRLCRAREQRLIGEADDVLRRLWEQFNADVRHIVTVRHDACRFCHGHDHKYQFTQSEWDSVLETHQRQLAAAKAAGDDRLGREDTPKPRGGVGFDPRRQPSQQCPGCHGRGVTVMQMADLDRLTPETARLFAGVKQTRDGIEIRLVDQLKVADQLARHHGLTRTLATHDITEGYAEALEAGRRRALNLARQARSEAGISSH